MGAGPGSSRLPSPLSAAHPSPIKIHNYWDPLNWEKGNDQLNTGREDISDMEPLEEEEVDCGLGRGVTKPVRGAPSRKCRKTHFSDKVDIIDSPMVHNVLETTSQKSLFGTHKARIPRGIPKCSKLKVEVLATFSDGSSHTLQALVDTGAEVNLINPKWVHNDLFYLSPKPIRLGAANSHLLEGGKRQTNILLTFHGHCLDSGNSIDLSLPFTAYDADVICDIILSYGWLAENNIIPNPRRHGLHFLDHPGPAWVHGTITPKTSGIVVLESLPTLNTLSDTSTHHHHTSKQSPISLNTNYTDFITHWKELEAQEHLLQHLERLQLTSEPHHPKMASPDYPGLAEFPLHQVLTKNELLEIIHNLTIPFGNISYVRGFIETGESVQSTLADQLRTNILEDYKDSVFSNKTTGNPPKRGIYGEAEIVLKPGAVPVRQRAYQMAGERRTAWIKLTDQLIADGKN